MPSNKKLQGIQEAAISFSLRAITTEQFAILQDSYKLEGAIDVVSQVRFARDVAAKMVGVFGRFNFEQEGATLLTIEAGCHFQVADESWGHLCPDTESDSITLPKGFALHLAIITVGTARGILHVRTEQTPFHTVVLPTIDLTSMIKDDIVIA